MRYPTRCNKRSCQARRTLSKHPDEYKEEPKCHKPGCDGKMYVDKGRLNKSPTDRAAVCRNPNCGFMYPTTNETPVHRVNTKGCVGYEGYILEISLRGPVKNTPFSRAETENDETPF